MDYRLSGQRIFLVEDDLMLGESLSEILQAQGAEVNWHKNAERVMSCLQTSSYDLMILDIGLPKISGFELLAQLREMQQDLPVLFYRREIRFKTEFLVSILGQMIMF